MKDQDNTDRTFTLTYTEINNLLVQAVKHGINCSEPLETSCMSHNTAIYGHASKVLSDLASKQPIEKAETITLEKNQLFELIQDVYQDGTQHDKVIFVPSMKIALYTHAKLNDLFKKIGTNL